MATEHGTVTRITKYHIYVTPDELEDPAHRVGRRRDLADVQVGDPVRITHVRDDRYKVEINPEED